MNSTAIIALALGVFFLVVSLVNRARSASAKRRRDAERAAVLAGGTAESPVHLESPFGHAPAPAPQAAQAPAPAAPQTPAPAARPAAVPQEAPAQAPAAPAASGPEGEYAWE